MSKWKSVGSSFLAYEPEGETREAYRKRMFKSYMQIKRMKANKPKKVYNKAGADEE